MDTLIPNRLLFRFEFVLPHRPKPPAIDGRLRGWTDRERLPALGEMDGERWFAPLWSCWNDSGIYIATHVRRRRSKPQCDPKSFWKGDNLRLMLDMRDNRSAKRATRFCQHFYFLPNGGKDGGPVAAGHPIMRAQQNAPAVPDGAIEIGAIMNDDGYQLEARIPAACLSGFDPSQHRRLGFFVMLEDTEHGRQSLSIGDDLPWHVDPSLWATAVLE